MQAPSAASWRSSMRRSPSRSRASEAGSLIEFDRADRDRLGGRRRIPASAVGQLVRPLRPVKAEDIPPLTLESSLFSLAGRFRSAAAGPGASDKHRYLGAKR